MDSIQLWSGFALKSSPFIQPVERDISLEAHLAQGQLGGIFDESIVLVILSKAGALAPQFHCHLNSHNLTMHHCFTPFRNSRSE